MQIDPVLLDKTCKNTIETILFCLPSATRGTIYTIGPMPGLRAVKVASGYRESDISVRWVVTEPSDYDPPGRLWNQYRDSPDHVLEAMGWCVERQKSWTADNPDENIRSVRKQLSREIEDTHHMEPVLVPKADFHGERIHSLEYPVDWNGDPIWQDTEYVVVAVIKIDFLPDTIRQGDRSTKVIKKLSRSLGTEILSLYLRETYLHAREKLSHQRLQTANMMAHELRNTLAKLGFVFSAVNAVMSFLREQWEVELKRGYPYYDDKAHLVAVLTDILDRGLSKIEGQDDLVQISAELRADLQEMDHFFPLPQQGKKWLFCKIRPKWDRLLKETDAWKDRRREIEDLIKRLERAIWVVVDEELASQMKHLPREVRTKFPRLAYTQYGANNYFLLKEVLRLLNLPELQLPHKEQLKRAITSLSVMVETISSIEDQANRLILSLRANDDEEPEAAHAGALTQPRADSPPAPADLGPGKVLRT